jgi:wobble nucleotide-excising tRNase
MIKKIIRLQNVGLMRDACADGVVDFGKVTAVYAENGRGKSTLASILRAAQMADSGRLNARQTIDSPDPPQIQILLPDGNKALFDGKSWSGTLPDSVVFDSEFVEKNVYSGFEVRPEQRQALLEFVLGEETVELKQKIEKISAAGRTVVAKRTEAERVLSSVAHPYKVAEFVCLGPDADAVDKVVALRTRLEAATNVQKLAARPVPTALPAFQFDANMVFDLLGREVEDVEDSAEGMVRAHLKLNHSADFEDWLSSGQKYVTSTNCPFCNQPVGGIDLIQAYRSFFNAEYAKLKEEVAEVKSLVEKALDPSHIDVLASGAETNEARIQAWRDRFEISLPQADLTAPRSILDELRGAIRDLVAAKNQQPLARIGSEADRAKARAQVDALNEAISSYNAEIEGVSREISKFQQGLELEDPLELQGQIGALEAAIRRQEPQIVQAATEYVEAEAEKKRLDAEKTATRKDIDVLMGQMLGRYQASINEILASFGAEFSVEQLKPSYVGSGEPRTDYGLRVREQPVKLGTRADLLAKRSFATTLSEADKRTLAFAFFVARLHADSSLEKRIVVLDDPVSSLDRGRRTNSIRTIGEIATKCGQLIVLSHDPYFVRDLRDYLAVRKPDPIECVLVQLRRAQSGYSAFSECDIDDICCSPYYRHHSMVSDYVDGTSKADPRDVAKAIRPLIEGYYHRRFPGRIPRRLMFGQIISIVADPTTPTPLSHLRPIVPQLRKINEYAGQFHHDANENADSAPVVEAELLHYTRQALDLIYQNG